MKATRTIIYISLIAALVSAMGCKKFLDILPTSQAVNPTKIKDFQEMLNNDSLSRGNYFLLDLMTDDAVMTDGQYNIGDNTFRRAYKWDDLVWNPGENDPIYNSAYARILQSNIILTRIEDAPKDELNTPENKSNVISQALIARAWHYFQLVNTYGKSYNEASASTDLSVPLVLIPDAQALQGRASVRAVYDQIVSDLRRAVSNPYLKAKGVDIIHPGKAAGFGLLSRTYLYKGDYAQAAIYADSALLLENRLLDMTATIYRPSQLTDLVPNPEVLVAHMGFENNFNMTFSANFNIGQSLLDSLGGLSSTDRRYVDRFNGRTYRSGSVVRTMAFDNSVGVPEIMLIKAECLARAGSYTAAGELITALRKRRLPASAVGTRTYTAANTLRYVIGERRRELCFRGGLRLFDLKRLNSDPLFKKDIVRLTSANVVLATLAPESLRYLLPFSTNVITANPKIIQNPR